MMHLLIPILEHSAPYLAAAIGSTNPIAGVAVNAIAKMFGGDSNDIPSLVDNIKADSNSNSKLQILDNLLGTPPINLMSQRIPDKIDLHLILTYPSQSDCVDKKQDDYPVPNG